MSLKMSDGTTLSLNDQVGIGHGVQVLAGVTGLGLPPVTGQWIEGAGDGAKFAGNRVPPRQIDLPINIYNSDRAGMTKALHALVLQLTEGCQLRIQDDDGTIWTTDIQFAGGGDYTYGTDTIGNNEMSTVITVQAGDPYFTSTAWESFSVDTGTPKSMLGASSFSQLQLSRTQTNGKIKMANSGTATAYPIWTVQGPLNAFHASDNNGNTLGWIGTLNSNETLTFDCHQGTVVDQAGNNRYSNMDTLPRFWTLPPGTTVATISVSGGVPGNTRVDCTWHPRAWLVI